jgi:hypothetical protein
LRLVPFLTEGRDDKMRLAIFVGIPDSLAGFEMNIQDTVG